MADIAAAARKSTKVVGASLAVGTGFAGGGTKEAWAGTNGEIGGRPK